MRLCAIRDRLADECRDFRSVLLALSGATPPGYPSAYVIPLSESADANALFGVHEQRTRARFAVEIMLKHAGQAATGGPAQEDLEDLRDAVYAALAGWTPEGMGAIDFEGGKLLDFGTGMVVWRDEFTTEYFRRT